MADIVRDIVVQYRAEVDESSVNAAKEKLRSAGEGAASPGAPKTPGADPEQEARETRLRSERDTAEAARETGEASGEAGEQGENAANSVTNALKKVKSALQKVLAAIGISLSLSSLSQLADEYYEITRVLETLETDLESVSEVEDYILAAANGCAVSYAEMADAVYDLVSTGSVFMQTSEDAADFLEIVNQALQASNATSSEISAVDSALVSAFRYGTLSAGSFATLISACPEALEILADYLGMDEQALLAYGSSGNITAKMLYEAFTSSADAIAESYEASGQTIAETITVIQNLWGSFISKLNETYSVTESVADFLLSAFEGLLSVLEAVTDAFDALVGIMGSAVSKALALAAAVAALTAAINLLKGTKLFTAIATGLSTLLTGPVGIAIAAIAALILILDDLKSFVDGEGSLIGTMFESAGIDAEEMREKIEGIAASLSSLFSSLVGVISELWSALGPLFSGALESALTAGATLLESLISLLSSLLSGLEPVIDSISGLISDYLAPALEALASAAAAVIGWLTDLTAGGFFEKIADLIDFIAVPLEAILSVIGDVFAAFEGMTDFLAGVFTGDWESAWTGLANRFIGIVNGVIDGAEGMVNTLISGLNSITSGLSSLWTWLGIPAIPEIPEVSWGNISYLAEGGYVGANSPTPAIIGDNSSEGEIVAPESKLFEGVTEALRAFTGSQGGGILSGEGEGSVILQGESLSGLSEGFSALSGAVAAGADVLSAALESMSGLSFSASFGSSPASVSLSGLSGGGETFSGGYAAASAFNARDGALDALSGALSACLSYSSPASSSLQAIEESADTRSITQNVYIYNTFGGTRDEQRSAQAAMQKSTEDIAGQLARAMAYAR